MPEPLQKAVAHLLEFVIGQALKSSFDWIFADPWPRCLLLVILAMPAWIALRALGIYIQKWKVKGSLPIGQLLRTGKGLLRLSGRIVVAVAFLWVFVESTTLAVSRYHIQNVAKYLTTTQRSMLISAYLQRRYEKNRVTNFAQQEQLDCLRKIPPQIQLFVMVQARESLIERGLLQEMPYESTDVIDTKLSLKPRIRCQGLSFGLRATNQGMRVGEYLFQKHPLLVPKVQSALERN